jgi:hypothetical protein
MASLRRRLQNSGIPDLFSFRFALSRGDRKNIEAQRKFSGWMFNFSIRGPASEGENSRIQFPMKSALDPKFEAGKYRERSGPSFSVRPIQG